MRVVLDTNVLVSALLSGGGVPYTALQLVLQGDATLLADPRILAEYDEVTSRSHFHFDSTERHATMQALARIAESVIARPLRLALPDPDDRMFVEVAIAGQADAIVTGNVKHFVPKRGVLPVAVLTPRALVDRLRRPI